MAVNAGPWAAGAASGAAYSATQQIWKYAEKEKGRLDTGESLGQVLSCLDPFSMDTGDILREAGIGAVTAGVTESVATPLISGAGNKLRALLGIGPRFEIGFSNSEINAVRTGTRPSGLDFGDVTFWRGEGEPPYYHASAYPGTSDITLYDSFFKEPPGEQIETLREEFQHLHQNITEISDEAIRAAEEEAKRFASGGK